MRFIIHIGPPKTGTSAIQKWCLEHHERLLKCGIYYPKHELDANGVSSGNLLSIYNRSADSLVFSVDKYNQLVSQAESSGVSTILLSSEFFFQCVPELVINIPNAVFVGYVRFELNIIESSYNQTVKRHNRSSLIAIPERARSKSLGLLKRYIRDFGAERFMLRAYEQQAFFGGNITSDLLKAINLSEEIIADLSAPSRVNNGYSLECLEYKRWFNQFEPGYLQVPLDSFLQSESSGFAPFSLLSAEAFNSLKETFFVELRRFCNQYAVENVKVLLEAAQNTTQEKIVLQHISLDTFSQLTKSFIAKSPENEALLIQFISQTKIDNFDIQDQLRFEVIRNLVQLPAIKKYSVEHVFSKIRGVVDKTRVKLLPEKSERSGLVSCNDVEVLSHNVPYASGPQLLKDFAQIFSKNAVLHVTERELIQHLSAGKQIIIPNNTKVIHGHFQPHRKHRDSFPKALHTIWVREPLERLWIHFEYALNVKSPDWLYRALLKLADEKQIVNKDCLFEAMLRSDQFDNIKFIYSKYTKYVDINSFDFVGSVHKYNESLKRLTDLIEIGPSSNLTRNEEFRCRVPARVRKMESLLSKEYELVDQYL